LGEHRFKKFINHVWVVGIGLLLIQIFLDWLLNLNLLRLVGNFFKSIGTILVKTFYISLHIPLWFILTTICLAIIIIIRWLIRRQRRNRVQHRKPKEYICMENCIYQGRYVAEGTKITTTAKNPPHFQLVE
jgi:hypothetical protein